MMSRAMRCGALLFVTFLAIGCGGGDDPSTPAGPSSPAPTPPPPSGVAVISGTWSGTSDFQQNGTRYVSNFTATIGQNDRTIQGNIRFTSAGWENWQATISGTVAGTSPDTQFVGTIDMQAPSRTGTGICTAQVTMAGPSLAASMRWEAPRMFFTNNVPTQPLNACMGEVFTPVWIFFR
jgi:hypothetical protein